MRMTFVPVALVATPLLLLTNAIAQSSPATIRWSEGAPNAQLSVEKGKKIEGLKTDTVEVFANLAEMEQTEYNRAWVQVINRGKNPLDFRPESVMLQNTKGKTIPAESPEKAAKSIQKLGESQSQELSSAHCNLMTVTGCQPTNTQMQQAKQVLEFANNQAQWLKENGLELKTLAPGEQIQGAIVFKKEKKPGNYILHIPIGNQIFEFPLNAQGKTP